MRKNLVLCSLLLALVFALVFVSPQAIQAQTGWQPGVYYAVNTLVTYGGSIYKCLQAHTSQVGWEPPNVPALWQLQSGGGATATQGKTSTPAPTFAPPTNTPSGSCTYQTWASGVIYYKGTIVKYPANGKFYLEVNNGTNGSDGTDPTISTWYWQPTTCSGGGGSTPVPTVKPTNTPGGSCTYQTWTSGVIYYKGTIVKYPANGNFYLEVNNGTNGSDGTDPTISTWYWQPTTCSGGGGSTPVPTSTGGFVVSQAQFNQMFPNRNAFYTYAGLTGAMASYPAFANTGSDTIKKQEAAAFLANVDQETGGLVYIEEINKATYCDSSNTQYPCAAGKMYYGRGPMQLSWNFNYGAAGSALGLNLLGNPDLVAQDSTVAWKTALWYWMTQTGPGTMTPHNAMVNSAGFRETIRSINGSIECNQPAGSLGNQEMQNRVTYYTNFTSILGVPTGSNLTC